MRGGGKVSVQEALTNKASILPCSVYWVSLAQHGSDYSSGEAEGLVPLASAEGWQESPEAGEMGTLARGGGVSVKLAGNSVRSEPSRSLMDFLALPSC